MNGITFLHDIKGMIINQRLPFLAHGFLPLSCLRTSKRSFVGGGFGFDFRFISRLHQQKIGKLKYIAFSTGET